MKSLCPSQEVVVVVPYVITLNLNYVDTVSAHAFDPILRAPNARFA